VFTNADRAALRRGVDPWEVRGFYELISRYPEYNRTALALAAPLLAEIRNDTEERFGRRCASRLSERRFRRLLDARDRDDLVHQLRAAVRILDRTANADELVKLVVFWGDRARRGLAQDYFMPTPPEEAHDDSSSAAA
jgi:CRISPR type I-E-associated protein CasB/Cse2